MSFRIFLVGWGRGGYGLCGRLILAACQCVCDISFRISWWVLGPADWAERGGLVRGAALAIPVFLAALAAPDS
jgi:hypothetical protein